MLGEEPFHDAPRERGVAGFVLRDAAEDFPCVRVRREAGGFGGLERGAGLADAPFQDRRAKDRAGGTVAEGVVDGER